ncbi:MAG: hypothetical protein RLT87_04630 [Gammaproteobacteria bacterium]
MKRSVIIFVVYVVLIATGIPWYWPKDSSLLILGVPAWVLSSILVAFLTSAFTAYLLIRYPWKSEEDADE